MRKMADALLGEADRPYTEIADRIHQLIASPDFYCRSAAATVLGKLNERCRFPVLVSLLNDSEAYVRGDAVTALCELGDSRAYFCLVRRFADETPDIKARILQGLERMRDPRSIDFLAGITEPFCFIDYAQRASKAASNNTDYLYRFAGSDKAWEEAKVKGSFIEINSSEDLTAIRAILQSDWFQTHPQTYVITDDGKLRVGGWVQEHVRVAKGNDILAAGEIQFKETKNRWAVLLVNNRSNGYFPHSCCLKWVKEALNKTDVTLPEEVQAWQPLDGFNDPEFLKLIQP